MDTKMVGLASMGLGAGRATAEDTIDPAVGLEVLKTVGDRVDEGEPMIRLNLNDLDRLGVAVKQLGEAIQIGEAAPLEVPLIHNCVRGN